VAEAAGQLGVRTEDIAQFTRTMIALGETTNLTADQAATSLAQLMNVMGTAPENVERLASALVDLGNNSATTDGTSSRWR
jgi:Phage-related minor tail protein.